MKLVCPSCESSFLVDATAIGPSGRNVRCGRCGGSWLAMPIEAIPEATPEETPAPAPPADTPDRSHDGAPDPQEPADALPKLAEFDETRRRSRSSRRPPGTAPKRNASLGGWALFTLVAAALVVGVILGRQQIMAWAPGTEPLYSLVGLSEEAPIPQLPSIRLELKDVTSDRRQVNGAQELIIVGEIFNPTDEPQDVPPLVATLMDPTGIELKRWVFAAETEVLPPGGRVAFETSTDNPPGQGNLNLNFVPRRQ